MQDVTYPLVSCLCVTRNKTLQLQRAINCFKGQSYPNKELIIVFEDNDPETSSFLNTVDTENTFKVKVPANPKLSLGELRNISIESSHGEYFCQWDDDDWYHKDRIMIQLTQALHNNHPASFLTNWLMYDSINSACYFSQFRLWEGSILCKRDLFNTIKYPAQSKSEDAEFLKRLVLESRIFPVVAPNLYIYVFHGGNTWGSEHFEKLFNNSQKLSRTISILVGDILDNRYSMEEASAILNSEVVLNEVNYFYSNRQLLRKG